MWTREDDVHHGRFRPLYVNRLRAGLDASGNIVAWHHRVVCDRVLAFMDPVRFKRRQEGRDNIADARHRDPDLRHPDRLAESSQQEPGCAPRRCARSASGQNAFANEVFMDEIAEQLGRRSRRCAPAQLLKNVPRAQARREGADEMADSGGRAPVAAWASRISITAARRSRASPRCRWTGRAARSRCITSGARSIAGVAVQPDNVIAQTESSIVYGLGLALTERITIEDGVVQQSNFYDYHVPRMNDVPEMHVKLIPTRNHPTGAGRWRRRSWRRRSPVPCTRSRESDCVILRSLPSG